MDLIYFLVSKRIVKLISAKHDNRIVALLVNAILEIKMIIEDKNIKSGKSGWKVGSFPDTFCHLYVSALFRNV